MPPETAFHSTHTAPGPVQLQNDPAPDAPPAPNLVQELERLWHLPLNPQDPDDTGADSTRTNAVQEPFDPLSPEITPELTEAVLKTFDAYKSQTKVIELVWHVSKSGTSNKYRAAKWMLRRILKKHNRPLPGKPWGDDPDDGKPFHEIIRP